MRLAIGKDVSKARTAAECMEIAGLDYGLKLEPVYVQGKALVDGIPVIGCRVPEKYAVVRQDTVEPIAIVGNKYEVVQNSKVFGFFDGLVEQGHAKFVRAYSTHNGAKVNIVANLGDTVIGGDRSEKRLTLRTSHDGSCRITGILEVYRLVCSNGLMAYSKESSFAVKHTKMYSGKLNAAKHIIGIADQYYRWFAEQADRLVNTPITPTRATELIKCLLPAADEQDVSTRTQNQREAVYNLYHYGKGNSGSSRWDLYNGIVEFVDHHRSKGRDRETATETNLVGSGAKLKQRAFALLSE
jgi:phage/plasmid-like protein (TIGR03299 family)